jgi:hypothetical protein
MKDRSNTAPSSKTFRDELYFAMFINKAHGQFLNEEGIVSREEHCSQIQLYVACSKGGFALHFAHGVFMGFV